jgi:hypothetical protein
MVVALTGCPGSVLVATSSWASTWHGFVTPTSSSEDSDDGDSNTLANAAATWTSFSAVDMVRGSTPARYGKLRCAPWWRALQRRGRAWPSRELTTAPNDVCGLASRHTPAHDLLLVVQPHAQCYRDLPRLATTMRAMAGRAPVTTAVSAHSRGPCQRPATRAPLVTIAGYVPSCSASASCALASGESKLCPPCARREIRASSPSLLSQRTRVTRPPCCGGSAARATSPRSCAGTHR